MKHLIFFLLFITIPVSSSFADKCKVRVQVKNKTQNIIKLLSIHFEYDKYTTKPGKYSNLSKRHSYQDANRRASTVLKKVEAGKSWKKTIYLKRRTNWKFTNEVLGRVLTHYKRARLTVSFRKGKKRSNGLIKWGSKRETQGQVFFCDNRRKETFKLR